MFLERFVVTAEGGGPGTNVIWAVETESQTIVAIAVNLFGRFDESDYMIDAMARDAFAN